MSDKVIVSKNRYKYKLYPVPQFNFEGIFHKSYHFPSSDVYSQNMTFWQTFRINEKVYGIKMKGTRDVDNPVVERVIYSRTPLSDSIASEILSEIEYRFDMKTDLNEFYNEFGSNDILAPVIERWRGMRISAHESLYEFLVITTVLQNATVRCSVQMLKNLFKKYGVIVVFDNRKLLVF